MDDPPPPVPLERLLAHRAWVRRVACAMVADAATAADLEQEAWLRALTDRPRSEASARGWFRTVLRRTASNLRRGGDRRRAREEAAARPEGGSPSPGELVEEAATARRVLGAVMDLAEPYRTTVLLRYYEDLPTGDLAARMGVPVETARTRLKRAHAMLRERLDGEEGGDRRKWMALLLPLARRARHGPPVTAVAGGSALGAATGVLIMGMKTKVVVAAACLVAAGAGWWAWRDNPGVDPTDSVVAPTISTASAPLPDSSDVRTPEAHAGTLPGATVEVTVVDGVARPIPKAVVTLEEDRSRVPAAMGTLRAAPPGASPVAVDSVGRASLRGIPPGSWVLRARAEGYADGLASADIYGISSPDPVNSCTS